MAGTRPNMAFVPSLITASELAAELRVSVKTIRTWTRTGRITPAATTPGGQYRYRLDEVLKELNVPRSKPSE
ncbi:helix-turn-helix domain-containing protein [Pseudonocardia sp. DLS-67]